VKLNESKEAKQVEGLPVYVIYGW